MRRSFFATALALLAGACTAPYDPPAFQVEPASKDAHFVGVVDVVKSGKRFGQPPTRIVMAHGMCSGDVLVDDQGKADSWLNRRTAQITAQLGEGTTVGAAVRRDYGVLADNAGHAVSRFDVPVSSPNGDAILTFLAWGRSVDFAREALAFEHGDAPAFEDGGPPKRASINAALKEELMDRCLVDAVVYLGQAGDPIRNGMRQALCDVFDGRFQPAATPGDAETRAGCSIANPRGGPIVIATESLGSMITFNALSDISSGGADIQDVFATRLHAIYLLANQIPLLDQAFSHGAVPALAETEGGFRDLSAETDRSTLGFLRQLGTDQRTRIERFERTPVLSRDFGDGQIDLVVFVDPNDILGYRLNLKEFAADANLDAYNATNVVISKTGALLGVVADPRKAHSIAEQNDPTIDWMMTGHNGKL